MDLLVYAVVPMGVVLVTLWVCLVRIVVPVGSVGVLIRDEVVVRPLPSGVHWVWRIPGIHVVRCRIIDMRQKQEKLHYHNEFSTRDQQILSVEIAVSYKVSDPIKVIHIDNPLEHLKTRVKAPVGEILRNLDSFDVHLAGRDHIQKRVQEIKVDLLDLGHELMYIEIEEIKLPADVRTAYNDAIVGLKQGQREVNELREMMKGGVIDVHLKRKVIESMNGAGVLPMSMGPALAGLLGGAIGSAGAVGRLADLSNFADQARANPGALAPAPTLARASAPAPTLLERRPAGRSIGRLVGTAGPLTGKTFDLPEGGARIGRDPQCEIHIPEADQHASRQHARLVPGGGGMLLMNISSANPILLDDSAELKPGEQKPLKAGEEFRLGDTGFRFEVVS